MRLGIDFGTTRIVAAAADRGNYPVAAFECADGVSREWYPPLVAVRGGQRWYGWDAWALQGSPGCTVARSLKRCLGAAGPHTRINLGPSSEPLIELLTGMAEALKRDLTERSSLRAKAGEALEVFLGVPANANGNQRFLTAEAFRRAGFEVLGLLNEPSAASIEYSHRQAGKAPLAETVLVYDLGGGTFDASIVERRELNHAVTATEGITTLGGDDFDEVLAELALEIAGREASRNQLSVAQEFALLEECRERKEALHPNTRRLVVDLDRVEEGWGPVSIPAPEFYARCEPLVEETLRATDDLLARIPEDSSLSLYVTGGGSELPVVGRMLRDRFGRKVRRSAYTRSATAIGLAIQAEGLAGYQLKDKFTRFFGVWREGDAGQRIVFDSLFDRGTVLPAAGERPLVRSRKYSPVHNVGHFRYLECTRRSEDGQPVGDITNWDEIRFPYDPALRTSKNLDTTPVQMSRAAQSQAVEEQYSVDASGSVVVTISNLTAGYSREFRLGRWASAQTTLSAHQVRRRRASK